MIDPSFALIVSRFTFDIASLFLWGGGLFACALARGDMGLEIWRRLGVARHLAVLAIVLAVAAMLPIRAAELGSGWQSALDGNLVWLMLWNTGIGTAWLVQAGCVLALVGLAVAKRAGPAVSAVLGALLLASTVLTGHAAMSAGWLKLVHQTNSVLHVLSAGAWVGSLLPLLLVLPKLKGAQAGQAREALIRFSTLGHAAVAIVVLSGFISAALILDGLPLSLGSTYEVMLWAKVAVVAVMVSVAVANRYYLVPRLRNKAGALDTLALGTMAELAMTFIAVGLVAWFGTLSPMTASAG